MSAECSGDSISLESTLKVWYDDQGHVPSVPKLYPRMVQNKVHRGAKDEEAACRKDLIVVGRPPRDNVWCVDLKVEVDHT